MSLPFLYGFSFWSHAPRVPKVIKVIKLSRMFFHLYDRILNMNNEYFGIKIPVWEKAVERIRQILQERAREERTIYYSELAPLISDIVIIEPYEYAFHYMLGEISDMENKEGRGMLSVIVIDKDKGVPGYGFFKLAKKFGRDIRDKDLLLSEETKKIFSVWSN